MRTSTYLRVATITIAAVLAACDASPPTSPSSRASATPTLQKSAGCTSVQGTIEPSIAGLWPDVEDAIITGSFQGMMSGSLFLTSSDGTHSIWEGSYIFSDAGGDLKMNATIDMKRNTGTPDLDVSQVSGTLTIVEGFGGYVGSTGGLDLSGMAGEFLNDPKSKAALKYRGTFCRKQAAV